MFIERCQAISSIQLEIMRNGSNCQFWKGITGEPGGKPDCRVTWEEKRGLRGHPADVSRNPYFAGASSFFMSPFLVLVLAFLAFSAFFMSSFLFVGLSAKDTLARPVSSDRPSMATISFFICAVLL